MKRWINGLTLVAALFALLGCEESNVSENPTPEPQPKPQYDVEFVAQALDGYYFGSYYTPGSDNYFFYLSDNGLDSEGNLRPNSTYYLIDIYDVVLETVQGELVALPEGTYRLDPEDSCAHGTIALSGANFRQTDAENELIGQIYSFEQATLKVESGRITLDALIEGKSHHVTYTGELLLKNEAPTPTEDLDAEVGHFMAYYYGEQFSPGVGNYFLQLSDVGWRIDDQEITWDNPNGHFYNLDIYGELFEGDGEQGITLPVGEYEIDPEDGLAAWSISFVGSQYWQTDEAGVAIDYGALSSGWLTVSEEGLTATFIINGASHTIHHSGKIYFEDRSQLP